MPRLSPDRIRLIVITDSALVAPRELDAVVSEALEAGAPSIQLREKGATVGELLPLARHLRRLTREFGALLFINDRVDLALATGADGVHLGPDDLPVSAVRRRVPDRFFIGFSTDAPQLAQEAVGDGADYIGCGTVWSTTSKPDAGPVIGLDGLRRVVEAVPVPVIAIGGVTGTRAGLVPQTGAAGVAVMSAVMSAPQPGEAVRTILELLDHTRRNDGPPARAQAHREAVE